MSNILNGKEVAEHFYSEFPKCGGYKLAIITIGDDMASKVYVRNKQRACERIGIIAEHFNVEPDFEKASRLIRNLNNNKDVAGIIIQKPYPYLGNSINLADIVVPEKDVDCLGFVNQASLYCKGNKPYFYPATPLGIITLLEYYKIPISGANVVVIGRSEIVGRPLATMLMDRDATVTVCHSKTEDLYTHTSKADIIITAVGKPKYFDSNYLDSLCYHRPVIIDVGINRDEDGKLCGDVDFDDVLPYVTAITPVPGGVGPMTVAMLVYNVLTAIERITKN